MSTFNAPPSGLYRRVADAVDQCHTFRTKHCEPRSRLMPREKMWVEYEDGSHLSRSHTNPGQFSPLTRDEENQLGQVTLSPVDDADNLPMPTTVFIVDVEAERARRERERQETLEAVAHLISISIAAAPHVKRFWLERARPALGSVRKRMRRGGASTPTDASIEMSDLATPMTPAQAAPGKELNTARAMMSSAEARARLTAAADARLFSDEQLSIVAEAVITDADAKDALPSPEAIRQRVRLVLEANPRLADDLVAAFDLATDPVAEDRQVQRPKP